MTHHNWNTGWVVATCSSFSATFARISRFCTVRSPRMYPNSPIWNRGRRRLAHCATEIACSPCRCDCGCAG